MSDDLEGRMSVWFGEFLGSSGLELHGGWV